MTLETVVCISFRRDVPTPEHDLLRAFRAGDRDAFARVLARVRVVIAAHDARLVLPGTRLVLPGTLVVPVPGHRAGAGNAACEALIAALVTEFPDLVPGPGVLTRTRDAPEAKVAPARDPRAEAGTLRWNDDLVPAGIQRVLLVDDAVRSGATLAAAFGRMPARLAANAVALAIFRAL